MHAANLLNKRRREERQQREDTSSVKEVPAANRDRDARAVARKTNSQTSFLDSIAGGVCTPTSTPPVIPSVSSRIPGPSISSPHQSQAVPPLVLYQNKQERISCAHIGLCVMIVGTIVTIIAGFVCYLIGFGEPGVIIGGGGGIIIIVGLLLLCFGSRWHLDELNVKKIPLIDYSLNADRNDIEAGRALVQQPDTLEVSKLTNTSSSDVNGKVSKAVIALKAPALEIDMISEEVEPSVTMA